MMSATMESALNRPVWFALLYWRPPVRDGAALALRFSPDIAPFGAAADDSPEACAAVGTFLRGTGASLL
jgi:hypothetical protein